MKAIFWIAILVSAACCLPTDPAPALHHLTKRTNPPLLAFNPDNRDAVTRRDALTAAFFDVYELASHGILQVDNKRDIYLKYFPEDWIPNVIRVFQRILPDPNSANGGPVLQWFLISDFDYLHGAERDLCAEGADAYTTNRMTTEAPFVEYSQTYFCPATFHEVFDDNDESGPAPRIGDLECDDFKFGDRYRVTRDMDFIGSTIFHEMIHFNLVSSAAFAQAPPEIGPGGDYIFDRENGYGPLSARNLLRDHPELTKTNADSYTWCALEVMWSTLCAPALAGQNGRFDDPISD